MQRIFSSLLLLTLTACMQDQRTAQQPSFTYQTEELPSVQMERGTLQAYRGQSAAYSDQALFMQTIESLGDYEQNRFQCRDLQMLQTDVVSMQENPARVEELWQLEACGVVHRYSVIFTREAGKAFAVPSIHYLNH